MSKTLEELGYEKEDKQNNYIKKEQWYECHIWFDKSTKTVTTEYSYYDADWKPMSLSMEELKAIYKYCEDNKWI